jgi:pectate lyase
MKKLVIFALFILIIVNTKSIKKVTVQAIDYVANINKEDVIDSVADTNKQDDFVGFATVNGKVTGGENGETVTVSNATEFLKFITVNDPLVIQVSGKIELPEGMHMITSNKTIVGLGDNAEITNGGLYLNRVENIIIQNISFSKASEDAIMIDHGSHHILIDHNDFSDAGDGLIDIIRESNYITISWNRFKNHDLTSIVGLGETSDKGKLKITYHHNWFDGTDQRHPRVSFGEVHVFNNYFGNPNGLYGIGVAEEAKVVSENNYLETENPTMFLDNPSMKGYIKDSGSYFVNSVTSKFAPEGIDWSPSSFYSYKLDPAENVKEIVMRGAGVGKLDKVNGAQN